MTLRHFFDHRGVQYGSLALVGAVMAYYWGFVFDFGYDFQWDVLYKENSTYGEVFGLNLLQGMKMTVYISLISSGIALVLGTAFGLARLSEFRPLYWFATVYVEFFRNTPLLVQLFFWYFALPMGLPESWRQTIFSMNFEFWSATMGLSVYTGAFMAEIVRAGVQSIPKGLLEAAYSSGLNYFQALRTVILPLAFRAIIPPLGSEFLNNMKNSSLAMVVGVAELCWQSQQIESLTFRGFEATTAASVLYLGLSLIISWIMNMVNARLRMDESIRNRSMNLWLATILFLPFDLAWRCMAGMCRTAGRTSRAAGLRYSRGVLVWKKIGHGLWRALILVAKVFFVVAVLMVLFQTAKGLMAFNWKVIADNIRTLLIWRFPAEESDAVLWGLGGLSSSIMMAVMAISVSFFIGLFVGLGRMSKNALFRIPCLLYIEIIRGNPLILVIFWVYFFVPIFVKTYLDVFWSATIALTIFTGAYLAEIVRGGIQNIPKGQFEAAYGTGLGYYTTMIHIVLPQALKQMIPAIVGQFIAIFKDTSLAYVIGVLELTFVAQGLNNRLMIYPFEIYTTVAALYFVCCYSMSIVAHRLETRLSPEKSRLVM
ncbi:MAG: amino acid ABC transporter permease [Deltaproteobacteria bacterium]|nr:amino acid ABC transporter permease [Deltaproteobacteria bacterium]